MVADLTRDGKIVAARIDSLTELGAKQSRPMLQGDVVIAVSGAPGLPAILAHDACIHDGFVGLRDLDKRRVDAEFLYAYLTFIRAASNSRAVGAIFKNLTTDKSKISIFLICRWRSSGGFRRSRRGRGPAGQTPRRPRQTRHPHPIHLPRYVRRSYNKPQKMAGFDCRRTTHISVIRTAFL